MTYIIYVYKNISYNYSRVEFILKYFFNELLYSLLLDHRTIDRIIFHVQFTFKQFDRLQFELTAVK